MCRGSVANSDEISMKSSTSSNNNDDVDNISKSYSELFSMMLRKVWPVPVPVMVVLFFYLFPPSDLLFGGYTRWYIRLSFSYFMTQNETLCKFLVVQGMLINLIWYAVAAYDYIVRGGAFGNILYRNCPGFRDYTLVEGSWGAPELQLVHTPFSYFLLAVCQILDLTVHLGSFYYFLCRCRQTMGYRCMDQIITWPILASTFLLARFWSLTRCWVYDNTFGTFYYGKHAYWLPPDSDVLWTVGYATEIAAFLAIVVWKIAKQRERTRLRRIMKES